jgi:hypothetical protein
MSRRTFKPFSSMECSKDANIGWNETTFLLLGFTEFMDKKETSAEVLQIVDRMNVGHGP